jgi:hypothetical protein
LIVTVPFFVVTVRGSLPGMPSTISWAFNIKQN